MANLKEIRTRIESVQSTEQITTAMRMVSASKLRKAQQAYSAVQAYSEALLNASGELHNLLNQNKDSGANFSVNKQNESQLDHILLFVLSSNKGLCGSFNVNAMKFTNELINKYYQQHQKEGKLHIMTAGKKAHELFERQGISVIDQRHDLLNRISRKDVFLFSGELYKLFQSGVYQKIILIYNKFKSVLTQELTQLQFLPILPPTSQIPNIPSIDFIMEPDMETIKQWFYPRLLEITLYRTFLESMAAEEGARMTAMQQASENASVLLKELKLSYNKARQAAITSELLEIIAGSEALNNQ